MARTRFSPYKKYKMNDQIRYTSVTPDGKRVDSAKWHEDRIREIRQMFLQKDKNNQLSFKGDQEEIMISILSGNDTFVILPTGSGKSLCFQAPSVFFSGITLVITPLVALMENQVKIFNGNSYPLYHPYAKTKYYENIRFKAIYPGMDGLSSRDMFSEILNPQKNGKLGNEIQYKFLYVSPERLNSPKFLRLLRDAEDNGLSISHVVIDEVHCMSQWGFEFRESYLYIADFIRQRPVRPIISAFTATATPRDRTEIRNMLNFPTDQTQCANKKYMEFIHMKERKNLFLHVLRCSDYDVREDADPKDTQKASLKKRQDTLIRILEENFTKVSIIYRTTTDGVDELYDTLKKHELLKDRVVKYHAQMSERAKRRNRNLFEHSYDENAEDNRKSDPSSKPCKNIMIATKAFGMGIDKGDISLVVHYDMPRSLEDYYQEVGRAGRNAEKIPTANCYLLYAVGPKKEKGTLQFTINWVTSGKDVSDSDCKPISSQFSDDMKENIYFWSYYRLCYVWKYCNFISKNPGGAHDFIIRYFETNLKSDPKKESGFAMEETKKHLEDFYCYINKHYPVPPNERENFSKRYLFQGEDASRFLEACSGQTKQEADKHHAKIKQLMGKDKYHAETKQLMGVDKYHAEIKQLMGKVNELHINNTYLANFLRHHPEEYQPGKLCHLPKALPEAVGATDSLFAYAPGAREHKLTFTIHGSEKLSYFDMCVLDAVYSIEESQRETIYVQTIWELLTGRNSANSTYSSQKKLQFWAAIRESIDKMRAMRISISDNQCDYEAKDAIFLPLSEKARGQKGYSYTEVPPLFQYAEEMNGQIIKVPVSLFNVEKIRESALWKDDFRAEFRHDGLGKYSLSDMQGHAFASHVKSLSWDMADESKIRALVSPEDYRRLDITRTNKYSFRPSMENALLCHYLAHRIAISKNARRSNYILFSTLKNITGICEDSCLFQKKAVALMNHYQNIGYFKRYYLYITNYQYQLTNGTILTDTAYFRAKASDTLKYWCLHDTGHLFLSDFSVTGSWQYNERLRNDNSNFTTKTRLADAIRGEGCRLSADAKKSLALVSLGRMDGIVLS